ncbi:MAG: hypothetical protein LBS96_08600 [Oscillospiraceae bacterium]|jgi:uridine kinase|nr:hypothetical protein [Oscillospiraceae bacterium]
MAAIHNELEYINEWAQKDPLALVEKSEARYRSIIESIAARAAQVQGHKLILLAGPSASGKTTTAHKIAQALGAAGVNTHRISLDDFYLPSAEIPLLPDGSRDLESIEALDLPLLRSTLQELMGSGSGVLPAFDFTTGQRCEGKRIALEPEDMIVLEGLHALNPLLTQTLGGIRPEQMTKVYISVASRIYAAQNEILLNKRSLRLVRRILRDAQFRKSKAEETLAMWPAVTRGEEQWLTPCKPFADVLINSIHIYEPCVFRDRLLPLLAAIPSPGAARLARSLEAFVPLPASLAPPDSLLREFLGADM